jgi:hypothetical protein
MRMLYAGGIASIHARKLLHTCMQEASMYAGGIHAEARLLLFRCQYLYFCTNKQVLCLRACMQEASMWRHSSSSSGGGIDMLRKNALLAADMLY